MKVTLAVLLLIALLVAACGFHLFVHTNASTTTTITDAVVSTVTPVVATVGGVASAAAGTIASAAVAPQATVLPSNTIVQFSTSMTATGFEKPYETPLILPGLTAATTDGYVAVASSTLPGYYPWQAFDQGPGLWIPNGGYDDKGAYTGITTTIITDSTNSNTFAMGEYVELQMPKPFVLMEYSVSAYGPWAPVSWTVAGSSDGTKWTAAHVVQEYSMPTSSTSAVFAITATLCPFTSLRFIVQYMAPPNEVVSTQVAAPYIQEVSFSGLPSQ